MARPERRDADYLKNKRVTISAKDRESIYLRDKGHRESIYLRDKGRCVDCGLVCGGGWKIWKPSVRHFELNGTHEIHHIIPLQKGGETSFENLILLCVPCHLKRHGLEKEMGI